MKSSLAEGVATLRRATSRVSSVLREGTNAAEEIVAAARETEAELVVVGSRVPDGVQRFFPVGTASRIANHAPCSVWVERVRVESG